MAGRKSGRGWALPLLAALSLLAVLTSCSAAAPSKKPKPSRSVDSVGRRSTSSIAFPLHGNIYPDGIYYATISIGEPPKPYFLDVDSGSDLTWLHCDAPCVRCPKCPHPLYRPVENQLVACEDTLCTPLPGHRDCNESPLQCDYEIEYADHGSTIGVLITDAFNVRLTNTSLARPKLAFGCGYDQVGIGASGPSAVDGVLGLGSGPTSLASQLQAQGITRSVVGHCLSRKGTGYLFFGDALIPSYGVIWTPMSHSPQDEHKYYKTGPASLILGKQNLGVKNIQLVFDSGSSYTYLAKEAYQAFLSAVKKDLSKTPLKETFEDEALPICWKARKPIKSLSEIRSYFRTLVLSFGNGRGTQLEIPPENYLIITKFRNVCLGILNGTEIGLQDLNLIGDISMQDLMVVYDNEKQQIGWVHATCDRLPNAEDIDSFEEGFYQPQFTNMGVLTEHCPAYYKNSKTSCSEFDEEIKRT